MEEREDVTRRRHGEPAPGRTGSQYNEEVPPGAGGPGEERTEREERETPPIVRESEASEEPGSSAGGAGEGTQSTGHPEGAG